MSENTWRKELQGENFTMGRKFHPGGKKLGWGEHQEVLFPNGATALVSEKHDMMQAVQIPGKRGNRLYVNGRTHHTKRANVRKGSGLDWTTRKTWTDTAHPFILWQHCKVID